MASTIFNLGGVKILKPILRFQSSEVQIITGNSADPTVTPFDAVAGSMYIRTTGEIYIKNTSGNNTDFRTVTSQAALDAHINDLSDAHAASAITNTPAGNLTATNVQTAVNELQSDIDTRALDSAVIKKDGSVAFTGNQSMGGNRLTAVATPTTGSDAANKSYVDSALEGLRPKEAVRLATTGNITLSGTQTIDGVAAVAGNRILVKDQTLPEFNGIYVVAAGAWSRSTDMDSLSPVDEVNKAYVAVQEGTAHAGKLFVQFGTVVTLGTDAINFTFFNSISGLTGGDGITVSGSNISVDHDGEGLQFVATQLALELDGATLTKSAAGLKLGNTAVTPGTFGSASSVPVLVIDQQGRATSVTDTAIAITSASVTDFNEAAQDAVGTSLVDSFTIDFTYNDAGNTITAIVVDGSITNAKVASGIDAAKISTGTVSNAEFDFLDGVTSSIQTQLNNKASTTLNNLGTTAINANLLPSGSRNLGSSTLPWNFLAVSVIDAQSQIRIADSAGTLQLQIAKTGTTPSGITSDIAVVGKTLVGNQGGTLGLYTDNNINTGSLYLETGNASAGTSGDIIIKTGTATTTRGALSLNAASINITDGKELRFNNTTNTFLYLA